jgi:hypothetical protein
MLTRASVALICVLAIAGCKKLADGAREEFSQQYTCPPERVEVRAREELDIYDVEHRAQSTEQPPAEVAADPGRLAMWRKERTDRVEKERRYQKSYHHLFEVRGCAHATVYNCTRPGSGSSPGTYYMCREEKPGYPPGNPSW